MDTTAPTLASLESGSLRFVLDAVPKLVRDAVDKNAIGATLLERIRGETESDEGVNQLLRMMTLHLHSSESITEALVELLYGSRYRVVLIHHIPQLTYQSPKCIALVLQAYKDLLECDGALLVPLLGSLVDMPLTPAQQNDVVGLAHALIDSVDEADVPSVIRSLLALLTPATGAATLEIIRRQARSLSLDHLHLVLDVMARQLYSGSLVLKYTLRSVRLADALEVIDGLWLVVLLRRSSEHPTVWKCLLHVHKKVSASWLLALLDVVASPEWAALQPGLLQLCTLLLDVAFHKLTAVATGTALISHSVRALTGLLACAVDPQAVLQLLLGLVGQSHKWAVSSPKAEGLRRHMATTAATGVADSLAVLPPFGHVLLDTVHLLGGQKSDTLPLLDPLCFAVVQLVSADPSLYSLLLLTIQKHVLLPQSPLQLASILLASHLTYARVLSPPDNTTITAWMLRLLAYAPLKVVPAVCTYLCADVNPALVDKHIIPALRRRRVLSATLELSIDDFARAHVAEDDPSPALHALAELVRCLVAYAPTPLLEALVARPLVASWPEEFGQQASLATMFQAAILVGVSFCNALFAQGRRDATLLALFDQVGEYYDQHKHTAHGKASLGYLLQLDDVVVVHLMAEPHIARQSRCVHVLYHKLFERDIAPAPWRLYGTHAARTSASFLHVPWKAWISTLTAELDTLNGTTKTKEVAETLLHSYAIVAALLDADRDGFLATLANDAAVPLWQAAEDLYTFLRTQLLALQDAQVAAVALDVVVLLCKNVPLMLQDVAQLARTLVGTVYPHAHVDVAVWKQHMSHRPVPLAVEWLDNAAFLKAYGAQHSSPSLSAAHKRLTRRYYLHHSYATWFGLAPRPLPVLAWTAELLTTMVTDDVDVAVGLRTCTRTSFPQLFTSFWLSLLAMAGHPSLSPVPTDAPYTRVQGYLQVVQKAIALAHIGDLYSSELARKTVPLLVRACQYLCERLLQLVDKCLQWRLAAPEESAALDLMSPVCYHVLVVLDTMERYVQYIQALMVVHMKTVMQHAKGTSKLASLVKKKTPRWTMLHRIPQVKQLPQLQRWIHRAKASMAATMHREQIPVMDEDSAAEVVVDAASLDDSDQRRNHEPVYRWQTRSTAERGGWASSDEEAKEDGGDDLWSSDDESDGGFHAKPTSKSLRTDIEALQTPVKLKLHQNEALGFQSIVVDFKTKHTTRL
ncbi:hypothetical protein ACHHYP_08190 [Achlya hypogyna]|uniref:Uncharacterized protein n=1 Tax=Achlya hypogyna TaxID=1202772 RepID=A0A1V9YPT4_ACHHY|nr:hypothetical protein ACHHYP_08190 [Achlya hypogyna]